MACEYLGDVPNPVCRARRERELVVPTIIEEVRYCLTNRFRDCVHWQRRGEQGVSAVSTRSESAPSRGPRNPVDTA